MGKSGDISPVAAILAVVASFFLLLFLGDVFAIWFGFGIAMVLAELLVIVIPLGYMLHKRVNIRSYIGLDVKPLHIALGLAFGALFFVLDLFISALLVSIFGPSKAVEESNNLITDVSGSPEGLLEVIAALSLAGICEEFTFRGFLQSAINRRYSSGIALLVSSLAFGLFHFDPQAVYIISAFLIGLVLGYIYHRWHSYTVSAVAHAALNLITLTIMLLIR